MITGPFAPFWSTEGQGALLLPAFLALFLSALIGVEREVRAKSAGLRTHTLVGLGAAVFMLVSKYGFGDLVDQAGVSVDPSRIAAQVVSGIGCRSAAARRRDDGGPLPDRDRLPAAHPRAGAPSGRAPGPPAGLLRRPGGAAQRAVDVHRAGLGGARGGGGPGGDDGRGTPGRQCDADPGRPR